MFPSSFFPKTFFPENYFGPAELVGGHSGKDTRNINTDSEESTILTEVIESQVIPKVVEIPPSFVVEYQEENTNKLIDKALSETLQDKIDKEDDILLIMAIIEAHEG